MVLKVIRKLARWREMHQRRRRAGSCRYKRFDTRRIGNEKPRQLRVDKKFGIEQRSAKTVEINRRFIFSFQGKRKIMCFDNHSFVQIKVVRRESFDVRN